MDTPRLRPAGTPITVASAPLPVPRTAPLALVREHWAVAVLAAILILAAVVRLNDLVGDPPGFFADEASYGYNAYTVLHDGTDEFGCRSMECLTFFKAFGEYKLPLYTYSTVPFIATLGLNELAVRLTTAVYGILTVAALYLFMKALFKDEGLALCSAAVLAILPWHIHYSRTGLGEIGIFPFFLTLSLYLFVLGARRPGFLIWSGFAFGLTLYSYRAAWVVLPVILPALCLLYWRDMLRNWQHALLMAVIIAVLAIPIGLHLLSVDSDRSQDESIFKLDLGAWGTLKRFLSNYANFFYDKDFFAWHRDPGAKAFFLYGYGESNLRHAIPGTGWLYWWQVPFIILGALALAFPFAVRRRSEGRALLRAGSLEVAWHPSKEKLLVLLLLAVFPLPSAVTTLSPGSARSVWGTVAFSMVTAYGVVTLARLVSGWTAGRAELKPAGYALAAVVFVGMTLYAALPFKTFLETYHGSYKDTSADFWGWQWGARNVIDRFESVQDEYDTLVMDGNFNAPQIFAKFYAPNGCDGCIIGNWDKYDPSLKQLFALRPESLWMTYDYDVKSEVYYPNGTLAFAFVEIYGKHNTLVGMLPNAPDATDADFVGIEGNAAESRTLFNQGNDFWEALSFADAYRNYQASIDAAPAFWLAFYNRAGVFATAGALESAISDYIVTLRYRPDYVQAHVNMGNAYYLLGQYEQAKAELDAAITASADIALAYADRGAVQHALGEDALASVDLDAALRLDPDLALAYLRRGELAYDQRRYDAAIADFTRALDLDPTLMEAYAGRGGSELALEQYSAAAADLERALQDRDYGQAYALHGIASVYTGDIDRAEADLAKAKELDRNSFRAPKNAKNIYWGLRDGAGLALALEEAVASLGDAAAGERLSTYVTYLQTRGR